jgi:hypothetical protein
LKIAQLDELLVIRHCIFMIGTSGNGKSSVWSTLAKTWTKLGRPTLVRDINPKAITANELYGYIQMSTRDWKDGLLSNQMRELGEIPDTNPKWCVTSFCVPFPLFFLMMPFILPVSGEPWLTCFVTGSFLTVISTRTGSSR